MIKKVAIAGLQLDNYTVRESIMQVEKSLNSEEFNTIEDISMEMVVTAGKDERVMLALKGLDHTLISEVGVLAAVDEVSMQRKHEIEENDFYYEFMKRVERNHKKIFVLGESMEKVNATCDHILEEFPKCEIVGSEALENFVGKDDAVVNEINTEAPDVVLSIIPSPLQEYFLLDNRDKLSTNLWYGMGDGKLTQKRRAVDRVKMLVRKRRFLRKIYHIEKKD